MKKILAAAVTLVLALSIASPAFAATKKHNKKHAKKHHVAAKHHAKHHAATPATPAQPAK